MKWVRINKEGIQKASGIFNDPMYTYILEQNDIEDTDLLSIIELPIKVVGKKQKWEDESVELC